MENGTSSARIEYEQTAEGELVDPLRISDRIYASSRSYRNDHCAIFIDPDSTDDFLRGFSLDADLLDPDESWNWTGAKYRKKLHRILVGDYEDWFRWFMRWQRFNAFRSSSSSPRSVV